MSEVGDIRENQNEERNIKRNIIFISVFTSCLFLLEPFWRDPLNNLSIDIMLSLAEYQTQICSFLSFSQFFELKIKYLIIFILLNFTNALTVLLFISLDNMGMILNGVFKLFYVDPRPFWLNANLIPCSCSVNYGNPSTSALDHIFMYLFLYKAITSFHTKLNKVFFGSLVSIPVIIMYSARFFGLEHTINQLLFGMGIGFVIYYFVFYVIEIDLKSKKLLNYLIQNLGLVILFVTSILLFITIIHLMINIQNDQSWLDVILKICSYKAFNFFDNESHQKTARGVIIIGCLVGLYLEYKLIFLSNNNTFIVYNMDTDRNLKFSDTSIAITWVRILVSFALILPTREFILSIVNMHISDNDSVLYVSIVRIIIPSLIEGCIIFFLIKNCFRYVNLTNEKLFEVAYPINDERYSTKDESNDECFMSLKVDMQERLTNNQ